MGMSLKEFADEMINIGLIYGNKFVLNPYNSQEQNDSIIKAWYRYWGKYDLDVFQQLINDWIIHKPNAPTIADLKSDLNKAQVDKYRALEQEDDVPRDTYINSRDWFGK